MYEKITAYILKNEMKKIESRKHEKILCQEASDGFILVCIGGHRLHRIYKNYFLLDLEKMNNSDGLEKIYNDCVKNNNMDAFAAYTVDTKDLGKLVAFEDRNGKKYFYREKYIKEYGNLNDLYLIVNPEKPFAPAIVVDLKNRSLDTGIICPVNYQG